MKESLALIGLLSLIACNPPAESESGSDSAFPALAGRWRSLEDSSWVLELTRACCGSKPTLEGSLSHGGQRMDLKPLSYANVYPVVVPESDSVPEYAMAVVLQVEGDGICAAEGALEDGVGGRLFPKPFMPDSAFLSLTFTSITSTGCDSTWAGQLFGKEH